MIYFDNAATTRTLPVAVDEMLPYFTQYYGNASTVYELGQESRNAIRTAKIAAAALLHAELREVCFTSGASESNNQAIKGAALRAAEEKGIFPIGGGNGRSRQMPHIITTKIEHSSVLMPLRALERMGFSVTYLQVDENGLLDPDALRRAIRPETVLISVMAANNEIGTIQPIARIGEIARSQGILFHTDAVQAFGQIPLDVREMKIDLLSASSHKLYGPKGAGLLYIRSGVSILPLIDGGSQEFGFRAGTENIPALVGFGKAMQLAREDMKERIGHLCMLRDLLVERIFREIPDVVLNGFDPRGDVHYFAQRRLPGNVNFCFQGADGESLAALLDREEIAVSAGSACSTGSTEPSHVLLAIGRGREEAKSALRLSLGIYNTVEEIDEVVKVLGQITSRLRSRNPLYHLS